MRTSVLLDGQETDVGHGDGVTDSFMLSESFPYRMRDTGQDLNRVQAAPKTSHMIHTILNRAHKSLGGCVGSTVIHIIHMGDHNVLNGLMLIDKYSQIYRVLLPILNTPS